MKIQVLGSGCATCKNLHKAVEEVVKKLKLNFIVEYSNDIAEIVKLGAMSSPVFAINGKLITAGKIPTNEEIEKAILAEQKTMTKITVQKTKISVISIQENDYISPTDIAKYKSNDPNATIAN